MNSTALDVGAEDLASGKARPTRTSPVASHLIAPRFRPPVMAFYRFARAADDVADNELAEPSTKLDLLEQLRASLTGEGAEAPEGRELRKVLIERGLTDRHALDLLEAFRRDCTKLRYSSWDDLMTTAAIRRRPVGRFVLDVHGESRDLWAMNDALCNALQVINHLQDCGKDKREIDRVYIPLDRLAAAGIGVERWTPTPPRRPSRGVIRALAEDTMRLLDVSRPFAKGVKMAGLALEVGVIQALAEDLCKGLMARDPLSQTVHPRQGQDGRHRARRHAQDRPLPARGQAMSDAIAAVDLEALWAKVRQSSFYAAMRAMPAKEREAMFAIYAFCARSTTSPTTSRATAPGAPPR
ncbi:MAG: squalene/phytoene synthase family protein [Caulobacteraceae bacterium]